MNLFIEVTAIGYDYKEKRIVNTAKIVELYKWNNGCKIELENNDAISTVETYDAIRTMLDVVQVK